MPAFVGLGTPYWEPDARGTITGITRGTTRAHLVRAALEAIAQSSAELLQAMVGDEGLEVPALRADGGAAANDWLMQFQADLLAVPVERPDMVETTALGAAGLAGLALGVWKSSAEFLSGRRFTRFDPGWLRRSGSSGSTNGGGPCAPRWRGPGDSYCGIDAPWQAVHMDGFLRRRVSGSKPGP